MDEQTQQIYNEYKNHLLESRRLSFEQFDKAILTLSGGGLGLSITFIHQVVPLSSAICIWALIISWGMFAGSILSTLISFILSHFAIDRQLKLAEEYYIENNEEAYKKPNKLATITEVLNILSAIFFIGAVCFLLYFLSINI